MLSPDLHDRSITALREYELVVRQEPKQARMCGVGGKGTGTMLDRHCNSS